MMKNLIEQSEAWWKLGMTDEARAVARDALAEERAAAGGADTTGSAAEWCMCLAFRLGEFESVVRRGLCEPRFGNTSPARWNIATSLHYLGRHAEAVDALAGRVRLLGCAHDRYAMACSLSRLGRADEAVEHLFQSLPRFRNDRANTWLDGDMRELWAVLARGNFSLATAHRLIEAEFDHLREWQPSARENWDFDALNFRGLPAEMKPIFNAVPHRGVHRLISARVLAAPELAERFGQWARETIAVNRRAFDIARRIALSRVLDAQPHYARAAWERRDLCALRYHVCWTVQNDPARIRDFAGIAGIAPLLDEMQRMLACDAQFFAKLAQSAIVAPRSKGEVMDILDSLPQEWSGHPLILMRQAWALSIHGPHAEALGIYLRICSLWPDDLSPYLNAAWQAILAGRGELVAGIRAHTPVAAHRYFSWKKTGAWQAHKDDAFPPELPTMRERPFRGQPDLGGLIITNDEDCALFAKVEA